MEQLMLSLPGINRHHNSPTLLAYHEARDDFEEHLETHFDNVDFDDILDQVWRADMCTMIGVPAEIEQDKVSRKQLELWTARYREAIALLETPHSNFGLLYNVKDIIQ